MDNGSRLLRHTLLEPGRILTTVFTFLDFDLTLFISRLSVCSNFWRRKSADWELKVRSVKWHKNLNIDYCMVVVYHTYMLTCTYSVKYSTACTIRPVHIFIVIHCFKIDKTFQTCGTYSILR